MRFGAGPVSIHGRGNRQNRGHGCSHFFINFYSYPLSVAGMAVSAGLYMTGALSSLLSAEVPLTPENGNAAIPVEAGSAVTAAWIAGLVTAAATLAFAVTNTRRLNRPMQLISYRGRVIEQGLVTTLRSAAGLQAVIYPVFLAMSPGANPLTAYLAVTSTAYTFALCARFFSFGGPSEGLAGFDSLYHLDRDPPLPLVVSNTHRAHHDFTTERLNRYSLGGLNAPWVGRLMPSNFKPHLNKPSYFYAYALIETFYFLGMMKLAIDRGAAILGVNTDHGNFISIALILSFLRLLDIGRVWAETLDRRGPAEASASHPLHYFANFAVAFAGYFIAIRSVAEAVVPGSSRGQGGSGPLLLGVGALLAAVFAVCDASATAYVSPVAISLRSAIFPQLLLRSSPLDCGAREWGGLDVYRSPQAPQGPRRSKLFPSAAPVANADVVVGSDVVRMLNPNPLWAGPHDSVSVPDSAVRRAVMSRDCVLAPSPTRPLLRQGPQTPPRSGALVLVSTRSPPRNRGLVGDDAVQPSEEITYQANPMVQKLPAAARASTPLRDQMQYPGSSSTPRIDRKP